jgi:hypothetical protein
MKTLIRSVYKTIPENVITMLKEHKVILAGGALERLANNDKVNDLDLYFRSKHSVYSFLQSLMGQDYRCICKGPRSLIFKNSKHENVIINAITFKYFKDANEVISYFDYDCCKCALDFSTNELITSPNFWSSTQMKVLSYTGSLYPVGALLRMQKYVKRGYTPDYSTILKLFRDIKNINTDQQDVLEEQIGGLYGLEFDIKGLTLDQIIEKVDTEIKIHKSGTTVELELDEYFHDLFGSKRLDLLIPLNNGKNEYKMSRYMVQTVIDGNGVTHFDAVHSTNITEETNKLEAVTFPIRLGKWVKKSKNNDGTGVSIYDNNFKYEVGKIVSDNGHGLHAGFQSKKSALCYADKPNKLWCVLEIEDAKHIKDVCSSDNLVFTQAKVISLTDASVDSKSVHDWENTDLG